MFIPFTVRDTFSFKVGRLHWSAISVKIKLHWQPLSFRHLKFLSSKLAVKVGRTDCMSKSLWNASTTLTNDPEIFLLSFVLISSLFLCLSEGESDFFARLSESDF